MFCFRSFCFLEALYEKSRKYERHGSLSEAIFVILVLNPVAAVQLGRIPTERSI
jgi:hypothetical protein